MEGLTPEFEKSNNDLRVTNMAQIELAKRFFLKKTTEISDRSDVNQAVLKWSSGSTDCSKVFREIIENNSELREGIMKGEIETLDKIEQMMRERLDENFKRIH